MLKSIGIFELLIVIAVLTGMVLLITAFFRALRGRPGNSQSARLKELEKLKAEGLVTAEEFAMKRKEIIDSV